MKHRHEDEDEVRTPCECGKLAYAPKCAFCGRALVAPRKDAEHPHAKALEKAPAVEQEPAVELLIEQVLQEHGMPAAEIPEALERLDGLALRLSVLRMVEYLRRILNDLEGTAAGVALRRAILGSEGEGLRVAAKDLGISHVALWKREKAIRKRLKG